MDFTFEYLTVSKCRHRQTWISVSVVHLLVKGLWREDKHSVLDSVEPAGGLDTHVQGPSPRQSKFPISPQEVVQVRQDIGWLHLIWRYLRRGL